MLTVATCLWEPNGFSQQFSRHYDETWAEKLYRGFARNLTLPFRFVVFTDRHRNFQETAIRQARLEHDPPDYGSMIEPFRLGEPSIVVGLDTVIVGNIDFLADYCRWGSRIALPNPYGKLPCNGVVLCPAGHERIYTEWRGENDMEWLREQPHRIIDEMWPGEVVSYKAHVRGQGIGKARVVYFHGVPKPHDLAAEPWIREHWR